MLGQRLDARGKPKRVIRVETRRGDKIGQSRLADRKRAGLVEGDQGHVAQRLQRLALAKQHAKLRRAARAGHDRGGRREAHRAGTGNDEHAHGIDQREGEPRLGADQHPHREGQQGDAQHDWHEDARDAIDQRLNRQFGALRLLDHADHAGQKSVGADASRAESEGAGRIDGRAMTAAPSDFLTGAGSPVIIDSST